jgi:hypothetical protein
MALLHPSHASASDNCRKVRVDHLLIDKCKFLYVQPWVEVPLHLVHPDSESAVTVSILKRQSHKIFRKQVSIGL